jgi:hypothetical protein
LGTCTLTNTDWHGLESIGFDIAGQHAYVADGMFGLQVVDMTDPAHPVHTTAVRLTDCTRVRVAGRYAYAGCRGWNEDAQAFRTRLQVLDLIDPGHPVKVALCDLPLDYTPQDLGLGRGYAFFALHRDGVSVIDIRDPLNPILVTNSVTRGSAYTVQAAGTTVCVSEGHWVSVLELTLPGQLNLNPPVLSGTSLTLSWPGGPGIKLQKTASLTTPNWQDVPGSDGSSQIDLPRADPVAFFRLIQP